jgi:hypothetical protein
MVILIIILTSNLVYFYLLFTIIIAYVRSTLTF